MKKLWNMKVIVILKTDGAVSPPQNEKRLEERRIRERIETIQVTARLKLARILSRVQEINRDLLSH